MIRFPCRCGWTSGLINLPQDCTRQSRWNDEDSGFEKTPNFKDEGLPPDEEIGTSPKGVISDDPQVADFAEPGLAA